MNKEPVPQLPPKPAPTVAPAVSAKKEVIPEKKIEKKRPVEAAPAKTVTPQIKTSVKTVTENKKIIQNKPQCKPPRPSAIHTEVRPPEKFRNGAGLWRAFARLSSEEQRKLLRIQQQNPEKFQEIMQKKVNDLYVQERARRDALARLAQAYCKTTDPEMKAKIKNDLRKKLHKNFTQRLQDSRKDLEANRARLLRMENELKKRENKQDAIVEAMLTNLLSGNKTSQKK